MSFYVEFFLLTLVTMILVGLLWQLSNITRGQRQVVHQLDNLSNLLRENVSSTRSQRVRRHGRGEIPDVEAIKISMVLASLAVGGVGIFLLKGFLTRK